MHGGVLFEEDSLVRSNASEIDFHEKLTLALVKELLIPDDETNFLSKRGDRIERNDKLKQSLTHFAGVDGPTLESHRRLGFE